MGGVVGNNRHLIIIAAIMLAVLTWSSPVQATKGTTESGDAALLKPGLVAFKAGEYRSAAEAWTKVGDEYSFASAGPKDLKWAGFVLALAALAFEKAHDSRACEAWNHCLSCFTKAGTNWDTERIVFASRLSKIRADVKSLSLGVRTEGQPAGIAEYDMIYQDLERELSVSKYAGLSSKDLGSCPIIEPPAPEGRTYFPKPFFLQGQTQPAPRQMDKIQEAVKTTAPRSQFPVATAPLGVGKVPSVLTAEERLIAQTAWQYFVANYQARTGMVNPVHQYPYGTLWDVGSMLAGYVAAEQLGLIDKSEFTAKAGLLLTTLQSMELYNSELPNREYEVSTAKMTDLRNKPSQRGTGWSALDLGRLLIWLNIVRNWYPELDRLVTNIQGRWRFDRVCKQGELFGAMFDGQKEQVRQEGRVGYEQYSAGGYALWGKDVTRAFAFDDVRWVALEGEKIPCDTRNLPYLTSDPFILAKIELGGLDKGFREVIDAIYRVQKKRWEATGIPTATTEDTINLTPFFVYNCVYYNGASWVCVDHKGRPRPELSSMSTKAAFGWAAIYEDSYAKELRLKAASLASPRHGYYGGLYDTHESRINRSLNVNTNAIILEAMLYLHRGRKSFLTFDPGAR